MWDCNWSSCRTLPFVSYHNLPVIEANGPTVTVLVIPPTTKRRQMEANTDPFTPGFGQFHGIPQRTLPDDCVEYTLIIIDQTSDQTAIRAELEKVKQTAEKFVEEVTADYIWQRGSFLLELAEAKAIGWHLHGKTEYGDSVDDEWLIVWILRELTRNIPNLWFQSGSPLCYFF